MDSVSMMAILIVLFALAVAAYQIRRTGAGYGARSVVCPETQQRARLSTSWVTRDGVSRCDVLQCSLMPGSMPVTCQNSCVAQL